MLILGVDPGIARTGWGLIEDNNQKLNALYYGCIETTPDEEMPQRLLILYKSIVKIIEKYNPEILAIEELFFNTNAKTALIVGQARGIVILAGAQKNIPLATYTPLQVKIAITGYGRAEKNQIGSMIKIILKLQGIPKPDDTADALAIAVTHSFHKKMQRI